MTDPLSQAAARAKAFAAGLANRAQSTAPAAPAAPSPIQQLAAVATTTPANINTSRAGTGPAPQTPIVLARWVIIYGNAGGLFIYDGTPALGNPPILSITSASADPYGNTVTPSLSLSGLPMLIYNGAPENGNLVASVSYAEGTDEFGNDYYQGFTSYESNLSNGYFTELANNRLYFHFNSDTLFLQPAAIYANEPLVDTVAPALNIYSPNDATASGSSETAVVSVRGLSEDGSTAKPQVMLYGLDSSNDVYPCHVVTQDPTTTALTPENWHDLTDFSPGWSAGSPAPRVKLLAESNFAFIEGVMGYDSTFSGDTTPCTLSGLSGYTPASNQLIMGTGSSGNPLAAEVTSAGDITLKSAPSGTNGISFSGMYALD